MQTIQASDGCVFRRKHDGFVMGDTLFLGWDYSTGTKRVDLAEYYDEVEAPAEVEPEETGGAVS